MRVVPSGVDIPESVASRRSAPRSLRRAALRGEGSPRAPRGDGGDAARRRRGRPASRARAGRGRIRPTEQLGAYYERAAVVACPSRREGYGVVAREAMAYGRPVVASAVGGLTDAVEDEVTGLLVPPEDPDALRGALERLLEDADLRAGSARRRANARASASRGRRRPRPRSPRTARRWRRTSTVSHARRDARGAGTGLGSAPLLRSLYREWFGELAARMSRVPGVSAELGSGIGRFQEVVPSIVTTDVEPTPWTSRVADAAELPFADGEVANLVLMDVFHHLARPSRFLDEATRVLAPGGRVLVLDPYCSPLSTRLYRRFHHERTDLDAAPFADDERIGSAPLASNQGRATLAFFRASDELAARWPHWSSSSGGASPCWPTRSRAGSRAGGSFPTASAGRSSAPRARSAGRPRSSRSGASSCSSAVASALHLPAERLDAELPEREDRHAQKEPAVAPAADVRLPVRARLVADRHVHDLQVEARRPEQEVEVAERVELPEVRAPAAIRS